MSQLTESYERWRGQRFPTGSPTDAVDELHADLALADTWVADSVIAFVENGVHEPARFDVVAELGELRRRTTELGESLGPDDRELVAAYAHYLDLLAAVYEDFLASTPRSA